MRRFFSALILVIAAVSSLHAQDTAFPFQKDDRVAWIGSSSTNIGIWPKTMEFLLRTRHPELNLTFKRFTTGGGTFKTGLDNLDKWLGEYKPTLVFFNYGGNDAGAGEKGLPTFQANLEKCVAKVQATKARVVLMPPQAADVRKSKEEPAARRRLYAETLLQFAKEKGWQAVDIHHPIADLQKNAQKDDDSYTILRDAIHLTPPAYIAWGYYLYAGLNPPPRVSSIEFTRDGEYLGGENCTADEIKANAAGLRFRRIDKVLPILPPAPLPPHPYVPMAKYSQYRLKVTGLAEGSYAISWEGKKFVEVDAKELNQGINLNAVLLEKKITAPWEAFAKQIWDSKELDQIGQTKWSFEIQRTK